MPAKLFSIDKAYNEGFFVEFNLCQKKRGSKLFLKSHKKFITLHLEMISQTMHIHILSYNEFVFGGILIQM